MTGKDEINLLSCAHDGSGALALSSNPNTGIVFDAGGVPVLRLTESGMEYMGQRVEDAGAAHKAFTETMDKLANQPALAPAGLARFTSMPKEQLAEMILLAIATYTGADGKFTAVSLPEPSMSIAIHVAEFLLRNGASSV